MRNHRSTIVGFAVLVVLMTAGAAQSLAGSNTVTSDDIVDFSIVANDIKTAAIGGRPIVDNSITGADVNESSLQMSGNCGSRGLIAGNVLIQGSHGTAIPNEFQEGHRIFEYNCSGGRVFVRRTGAGLYQVKFENNPHRGAVATIERDSNDDLSCMFAATVQDASPAGPDGWFNVAVNTCADATADRDVHFVLW